MNKIFATIAGVSLLTLTVPAFAQQPPSTATEKLDSRNLPSTASEKVNEGGSTTATQKADDGQASSTTTEKKNDPNTMPKEK